MSQKTPITYYGGKQKLSSVILETIPFHKLYCEPPYYNSDCGHYDGYSIDDFENLLKCLSRIEGKFLLSSYNSDVLKEYSNTFKWSSKSIEMNVTVNKGGGGKRKVEILTYNYCL